MDNIINEFKKLDDFDKLDTLENLLQDIDDGALYDVLYDVFSDKYEENKSIGIKAYQNKDMDTYRKQCNLCEEYQKMIDFIQKL